MPTIEGRWGLPIGQVLAPLRLQDVVGSSSTVTTNFSFTSLEQGSLLIAAFGVRANSNSSVTSITDDAGNTWTKAGSSFRTGQNTRCEMWYASNTLPVTTLTITHSNTTFKSWNVSEWADMDIANPLDASAVVTPNNSTTAIVAGPFTPTSSNVLVMAMFNTPTASGNTITEDADGFTAMTNLSNNTTQITKLSFRIVSAPTSVSASWTGSLATQQAGLVVGFRGANDDLGSPHYTSTAPLAPPAPSTPDATGLTDLPGWKLQASSNFAGTPVAAGTNATTGKSNFLTAYNLAPSVNDILNLKIDAFSSGTTAAADTRSNYSGGRSITGCKILSGNAAVFGAVAAGDVGRAVTGTGITTGSMVIAFAATGPDINGYGTGPRLTLSRVCTATSASMTATTLGLNFQRTALNLTTNAGSKTVTTDADFFVPRDAANGTGGVGRTLNASSIPPRTTIATYVNARQVTLSANALTSTTVDGNVGRDYGVYGTDWTVANGVLSCPISTDDAGKHITAAPRPKWNNSTSGTCQGGRWEMMIKTDALSTYKIALLMWPESGSNISGSTSGTGIGGNGEIDFPECNLGASNTAGGFMHYQDGTGKGDFQATASTTQRIVTDVWVKYAIEWRPNADRVSSTLKFLVNDAVVKTFTGSKVPNQRMNPRFQIETIISDETLHIDPNVSGNFMFAYIAFWQMI